MTEAEGKSSAIKKTTVIACEKFVFVCLPVQPLDGGCSLRSQLQVERYSIYDWSCTSDVLQLTDLSSFGEGPDDGDSVRLRLIGLFSKCFWSEAHFVKDSLCEFVDITICDVPKVRDQSWTATVKSIKDAN